MYCYTTDINTEWELCDVALCDYYLTTEWHQDLGDQAILVSPKLGLSATNCYLTYDIQLDGPNMTLELFVNSSNGDSKSISRIGLIFISFDKSA